MKVFSQRPLISLFVFLWRVQLRFVAGRERILIQPENDPSTAGTILDIILSDPKLATFVDLTTMVPGIRRELAQPLPFKSMLAPNNDAFLRESNNSLLMNLMNDSSWSLHLLNFVLYHFITGPIFSSHVNNVPARFQAMNDQTVIVEWDGKAYNSTIVNRVSSVVDCGRHASNGIVYEIDHVLLPTWFERSIVDVVSTLPPNKFSIWLEMGALVGFDKLFPPGPYTVFVPTDDAFSVWFNGTGIQGVNDLDISSIQDLVSLTIIPGLVTGAELMKSTSLETISAHKLGVTHGSRSIQVNAFNRSVDVIQTNHLANNGIIHVLSGVLSPNPDGIKLDLAVGECKMQAAMEELTGFHMNVACSCGRTDEDRVRMACTNDPESSTERSCQQKYEACNDSSDCCSYPMTRCIGHQCRASGRIAKTKIGDSYGGAVDHTRSSSTSRVRGTTYTTTDNDLLLSVGLFP